MADLLIIDDDPDGAEALSEAMRTKGHQVRVGYDGEEGLRLAHERIPDVALLDVEMPTVNGPEMAYRMFIHDMGLEEVPVIFLSGVYNLREIAERVGTPYFLCKPYRCDQIMALLRRALQERIPPRPGPPAAPR